MHVLVVNSGSSTIKFSIFNSNSEENAIEPPLLFDGELTGIGASNANLVLHGENHSKPNGGQSSVKAETLREAICVILDTVCGPQMPSIDAVGYRVVHPGTKLHKHQKITAEVLDDLEQAIEFAPLHEPEVVEVIREGMRRFPMASHYACFDSVFHRTMPEEATIYAIPQAYRERGVHRYGFHGLSCESVVRQIRVKIKPFPKRMVIAHLGSGCSVTALVNGCSVDNTMGLTPTGGVVMGTRPGDLDPGLILYLLRQQIGNGDKAILALETMLNHASGMVALTGMPNDMKAVRKAAAAGDEKALMALKVFTRSVTKAIGSFCWLLGGVDTIVFTGGIGEHDASTRAEVLQGLQNLGISIDLSLNDAHGGVMSRIHASDSKTFVFVVPAQEDLMIAMHVDRMVATEEQFRRSTTIAPSSFKET